MAIPLAYIAGAGVASSLYGLYKGAKNKPKMMNQDFSFDMQNSEYSANPNMLSSISNLNNVGNRMGQMGNQFNQQYQNMIDPNSAYNQDLIGRASMDIQDLGANRLSMQQQAIAQGGGPKRLSNLLGMIGQNQDQEAIAKASAGIRQQSLQNAGAFGNMASSAFGQQGNMFAQAGGLASQVDARMLQNDQFNAQANNQYQQYLRTSAYNQASDNNANQFAYNQAQANNWTNLGGSLLGGAFSMSGGGG